MVELVVWDMKISKFWWKPIIIVVITVCLLINTEGVFGNLKEATMTRFIGNIRVIFYNVDLLDVPYGSDTRIALSAYVAIKTKSYFSTSRPLELAVIKKHFEDQNQTDGQLYWPFSPHKSNIFTRWLLIYFSNKLRLEYVCSISIYSNGLKF